MYSSKESFDLQSSNTTIGNATSSNSKECQISVSSGFILTFLAIAIAVGVGIIVHFSNDGKNVICQCNYSAGEPSETFPSDHNGIPQVCNILARAAFKPLCELCSSEETTTSSKTSTVPLSTVIPSTSKPPVTDIRLPTSLKPSHYNLRLRPEIYGNEPKNFTFSGDIEIFIMCLSETNNITLHMKQMELTADPVVTGSTYGTPTYRSHKEDRERQFLIVELNGQLQAGQTYSLYLQFKGKMADDLMGLYKSYYTAGNKTVHLAFTLFEPTDARKAFPCFDEPALKATYNVSLDRKTDSDIMALTNTPKVNSVQLADGYTRDIFDKSVPMSTYLVAVAFTDFASKTNYTSKGTKVRVYSRPDYINTTELALRLNVELLEAFELYFDIEYSMPKLDSIAAPQFNAGAMEHWGLVTYIDYALFYTPGKTSTPYYDFTHVVISHELAHQWCGNLVSPEWWDDLWLNEGFATYMSYVALDMIRPSWKTTEFYTVKGIHSVMEIDGYETSHPIHMDVNLPAEIESIFDAITYTKGSAVIRMMNFFLGDDTFRFGMQEYLRSKHYSVANHNDLYTSLENRARGDGLTINLENVMDTWVEQMNYPVVNVTYDANTGKIHLHQQRFLYACVSNRTKCEESSFMWEIPFTYTTSTDPKFDQTFQNVTWISKSEQWKEIPDMTLPISSQGWVLGNIQQYGYYRVMYSQANWNALQMQLMKDHTIIHVLNRAQLIDDAWALSKAGMLDVVTALNMMNYLTNETEYTPWLAAKKDLELIDALLEPTGTYGKFEIKLAERIRIQIYKCLITPRITVPAMENYFRDNAYMVKLLKGHFAALDITNVEHKSVQDRFLARMIFDLSCKYFIQDCEDEALQLFTEWRIHGKTMPPDVQGTIMCTAVREGGEMEWNHMYDIYKNSGHQDAINALYAMGCTRRHWLQRRLLDYSLLKDKINREHMKYAIAAVATNPDGYHQAWDFLMANWNFLIKQYKLDTTSLNQLLLALTRAMSTDINIQQVIFWRDSIHPKDSTNIRAFDTAIQRIHVNKLWFERNLQKIDDWLGSQI